MIAWLEGRVLETLADELILNVNGVGYGLTLGANHLRRLNPEPGMALSLAVHTEVKEDDLKLFGFESFEHRSLFHLLKSVNGVGPKAAMNLVDQMTPKEMIFALQTEDHVPFTKVSGIGNKTAQRIVLDLHSKIGKIPNLPQAEAEFSPSGEKQPTGSVGIARDAKSALMNLGYSEQEASKIIRNRLQPDMTLDELIRIALSDLNPK